nr:MAG: hypothetical protein JDMALPPM_00007 [Pedacovirus sp. PpiGB01]
MLFFYLALLGPFIHFIAETLRACYNVHTHCYTHENYRYTPVYVDGSRFTSGDVCIFTHPDFIYLALIFTFVSVPLFYTCLMGLDVWDNYIEALRRIHHWFIRSMLECNAAVIFLLALFLIVTWSLGLRFM